MYKSDRDKYCILARIISCDHLQKYKKKKKK